MEFISTNSKYTYKFLKNLKVFVEEYSLFTPKTPLLVAVSGGVDSMAILFALVQLRTFGYSNQVRAIHINHNTREGQDAEEQMVREYCSYLDVEFKTVKLDGLNTRSNFENDARVKRYDKFYQHKSAGEKIILAHHIDDSFEWTMLQSLRSSSINGLVGVPLVNRSVVRPFMCVTKRQILKFVEVHDLPFLEDPTNEILRYERNFIRESIIKSFKDRYPKYLKHYVYRHNEIARRLGLHHLYKSKSSFNISFSEKSALIYSLATQFDPSGLEKVLLEAVMHLSDKERGSVQKQIQKVVEAARNNKYGPLSLVGGIKVYLDFNCILMTKKDFEPRAREEFQFEKMNLSFEKFTSLIFEAIPDAGTHSLFPFLVKVKTAGIDRRSFNTTFNTEIVDELRAEGTSYYPALKLLREWSKKRNRHKVLKVELLKLV